MNCAFAAVKLLDPGGASHAPQTGRVAPLRMSLGSAFLGALIMNYGARNDGATGMTIALRLNVRAHR